MNKAKSFELQCKIAGRAEKMGLLLYNKLSLTMDLEAAQIAFNLDLEGLLAADDFNFAHDVFGIQRNINRNASSLFSEPPVAVFENCFLPRYARAEA